MFIGTNGVDQAFETHKWYWGGAEYQRTVDSVIEEMGELQQALMKVKYAKWPEVRIREELADLLLALDFLARNVYAGDRKLLDHDVTERAVALDIKLRVRKKD